MRRATAAGVGPPAHKKNRAPREAKERGDMDRQHIKAIAFWTTTILGPASFVIGGVLELQRGPEVVATLSHLGYPVYFAAILGTWKLLGAIAIAAPGLP